MSEARPMSLDKLSDPDEAITLDQWLAAPDPAPMPEPIRRPHLELVRGPDPDAREFMQQGACREYDTEVFFPGPHKPDDVRAAKAICALCPVRAECLEYALLHGEHHGVWGGMAERERRKIRGQRRRTLGQLSLCSNCGTRKYGAGPCSERCRLEILDRRRRVNNESNKRRRP